MRGTIGESLMTPDFVLRLGYAAGKVLKQSANPAVCIGKDTRISGYMIESALEAGFSAAMLTYMCADPDARGGVPRARAATRGRVGVISASHNPYADNGIKILRRRFQAPATRSKPRSRRRWTRPWAATTLRSSARSGASTTPPDATSSSATTPHAASTKGLRIVLDCAHGAAYNVAPHVFHELGAEVSAIGITPDGMNINAKIGATAPARCARK